jgi:hypothetical protein
VLIFNELRLVVAKCQYHPDAFRLQLVLFSINDHVQLLHVEVVPHLRQMVRWAYAHDRDGDYLRELYLWSQGHKFWKTRILGLDSFTNALWNQTEKGLVAQYNRVVAAKERAQAAKAEPLAPPDPLCVAKHPNTGTNGSAPLAPPPVPQPPPPEPEALPVLCVHGWNPQNGACWECQHPPNRKCAGCGKVFWVPGERTQPFCTPECGEAHHQKTRDEMVVKRGLAQAVGTKHPLVAFLQGEA